MCTNQNFEKFKNWLEEDKNPPLVELPKFDTTYQFGIVIKDWIEKIKHVLKENKNSIVINLDNANTSENLLIDSDYLSAPIKSDITNIVELRYIPKKNQTKKIKNLNIRQLQIPAHGSYDDIEIDNCWIDVLDLQHGTDVNLFMNNVSVGKLLLREESIHKLDWKGGCLLSLQCPPPSSKNPFTGHVRISGDFYLPKKDNEYKNKKTTPQPWTNIRAHLMALDNIEAAGIFHSVEQNISGPLLPPLTRFFNYLYGLFSDYGNSLKRPLIGILSASTISFLLFIRPGSLSPAKEIPWVKNARNFTSSAWISIDPIINPLGILNDSDYFEPTSLGLAIFHTFHRVFIVIMIFFFFLALRRKFRITA